MLNLEELTPEELDRVFEWLFFQHHEDEEIEELDTSVDYEPIEGIKREIQ
jgi:hypothetical protein